jgi:signal transduction histidine kinase
MQAAPTVVRTEPEPPAPARSALQELGDLVAALHARERQQAAVARLGHQALSGLELQDLFDAAMRAVADTLGVGHVGLCSLRGDRFTFDAGLGWRIGIVGSTASPPESGSMAHFMLHSPDPVVYHVATETRFRPASMLAEHGIRSGMIVLVPGLDRPWGILGAHATLHRDFTPDDSNFLEGVAHVLASAIERKTIEADLEARERQQAAVARLGQQALANPDLPDLFAVAAKEVAATLAVDLSSVLELEPTGHRLRLVAGCGWRDGLVGQLQVPAGATSHAAFSLASTEPVLYEDLATDGRFTTAPLLESHSCRSGMTVAIRSRGKPIGLLGAHSRTPREFTTDDSNFLLALAHVLGSAMERRRAEDELRSGRLHLEEMVHERTRQLAASNRELEAFSYSVSHDLRAPLRTISGYTSLMEEHHRDELSGEALHLVEGVRKSADRLGRLIDDLLDLSRVQRVDLVRREVDLSALTAQVVAELRAAEPDREVALDIEPGLRADGDARLLSTLMQNLLANALKFTRHTAQPRINVGHEAAGAAGDGTVFVVRDNGAGFDMAFAPKLFHPFQRLHRASEFEGTGVGLATVARIVERHGGRVWAEGRVGAGAAVYFTLGTSPNSRVDPQPV